MKRMIVSLIGAVSLGIGGLVAAPASAVANVTTFDLIYDEATPGYINEGDGDYKVDYESSGMTPNEDIVHVSLNGEEIAHDWLSDTDGDSDFISLTEQKVEPGDVYRAWVTKGETSEVLGEDIQHVVENPVVTFEKTTISVDEINHEGIDFTGSGFVPNHPVSLIGDDGYTGASHAPYTTAEDPVADSEGKVSGTITANYKIAVPSDLDPAEPNHLSVDVHGCSCAGSGDPWTPVWTAEMYDAFTIVSDEDSAPGDDGDDEPNAPEAPVIETAIVDESGLISGSAEPGADVKLSWKPASTQAGGRVSIHARAEAQAENEPTGEVTVRADSEGNFTVEAPAEAGMYDYTAIAVVDGIESAPAHFTVTVQAEGDNGSNGNGDQDAGEGASAADGADGEDGDDGSSATGGASDDADGGGVSAANDADGIDDGSPADRSITIKPEVITAADFVNQYKGVTITVRGFDEGENVTLTVASGPNNVESITLNDSANEESVAAFTIFGTNASDPLAYLGEYDVRVIGANDTGGEAALIGSFSVVADGAGNGGGGNDGDGADGSDLPRTGAELTGLGAGVALLLLGGGALVVTKRRKRES